VDARAIVEDLGAAFQFQDARVRVAHDPARRWRRPCAGA
jgi:hypothetical protein